MTNMKTVNIKALIDSNLISPGCEIVWKRRAMDVALTAIINKNGNIETSDGVVHKSPSGAARHFNSGKPIDGWNAWRVKESNETLSKVRIKFFNLE